MNCQIFETIVNDLARTQIMETSVREQALAHHRECAACAQRLEDEQALSVGLRALAAEMKSLKASDRVAEHLLVAFRGLDVSRAQPNVTHHWRYWTAAAAALLIVILGITAMRFRMASLELHEQAKDDPAQSQAVSLSPATVVQSSDSAMPRLPRPAVAIRRNRAKAKPPAPALKDDSKDSRRNEEGSSATDPTPTGNETLAANYSNREIATDFLPVGYATPMTFQDGGQMVRVELPRSALASFGLPVNLNRANERVKADVLIGSDGQARAIRFVQ